MTPNNRLNGYLASLAARRYRPVRRRPRLDRWLDAAVVLLVGVSLGLALGLALRPR